ncbi:hypothetical protein CQW23_15142 [Capsicum baccatum]|uniref:Uncharacterized protein n=1 Tax=Capsicum baccatum TaxID=33114 RepID=A0A2G2WL69_CAPBA|nr:hypothetical protein CQW23_15142 [Capsicum baccatum]
MSGKEIMSRLTALAAAEVYQQNIDNPGRATNPDDEDLGYEELLNPRHTIEVAAPMHRRDRQARLRPDCRAMQIPFDDDDDDLDGAGATGAIILPPLAPGAKDESDSEEEANYLNNQGGFLDNAQGNQGRNYYEKSGYNDRDLGSWKNNSKNSGLYVPPGRRDATASSSGNMEDMMAKLLKGVEATSAGVTKVINDLSSMKQLVDSHSNSIKQIEKRLSQLSAALNQRKAGTLPSNTVQNPRNDGSCMDITTRSGNVLENPSQSKQVDKNKEEDNTIEADHDIHDVTPSMLQHETTKI